MGCDMVVALPAATDGRQCLFGANIHRPPGEAQSVRLVPRRNHAGGETLHTRFLQIPQVRQTFAALAVVPQGNEGWLCGVNERRVAVSCSNWQSRFQSDAPGLLGPELVRLTLERAHGAEHALEVLTDLIARHGQGCFPGNPEGACADHVFLLADPNGAFAVEAAGPAWAAQEIHQVRAAGDVAVIRQDWYRLAAGLADRTTGAGWWIPDGSKLDFAGTLCEMPTGRASALRRWGRATLFLEQQNGHLDGACLRQLLADHYDATRYEVDPLHGPARVTPLCQHGLHGGALATAVSVVAQLPDDEAQVPIVWVALGPPCVNVHFPLLLESDLPAAFWGEPAELWARTQQLSLQLGTERRHWLTIRELLSRLQARFEQDVEDFLSEALVLKHQGEAVELRRLAGSLMQSHVERYEETLQLIFGEQSALAAVTAEPVSCGADF